MKYFTTQNKKSARAFTFIELMVCLMIIVGLSQATYFIYNNFLVASKRLSVMNNSNQEMERLRAVLNKDLRAAVEFEIEDIETAGDAKRLILTCAGDEAAIDDVSITSMDNLSRTANPTAGTTGIAYVDAGNNSLYYTVTYEYRTQKAMTLNSYGWKFDDNPNVKIHPEGVMELREGVIIRTGPYADPYRGNVTQLTISDWTATPAPNRKGIVVSDGWLAFDTDPTNLKPVFSYWPDSDPVTGQASARGVSITLWRHDSFKTPTRRYDYPQEFSTTVTSRLFR